MPLPEPMKALPLFALLEDAHRAGRVDEDVFRELAEDFDALCGERSPLPRARANVSAWEETVRQQVAQVAAGTCLPSILRESGVCLRHALSELDRLEQELRALKVRLWDALVLATSRPPEAADTAH